MASCSAASRLLLPRVRVASAPVSRHLFQSGVSSFHCPLTHSHFESKQGNAQGFSGARGISSLTQLLKGRVSSKNDPKLNPHPADEVEAQRPLAPDPYDSTYQMPAGAPDARNISRERFHQFMHGKPQRFSKELKVTVMGCTLACFGIGVTWLTAYIMRPDDFEWVEEERRRIQEAKERIQQRIERAQQIQNEKNT